jgi:RsiW-degrading membrane proteinase PrsW (M82 family)
MLPQFLILLALGVTPSFVWLLFYLKEDPHPEPKRWLLAAFLSGMGAVPIALVLEQGLVRIVPPITEASVPALTASTIVLFLGVALIEENAKFLAARTLLLKNPVFDEPVDAMIYMVTAALGFAALENIVLLGMLDGSKLISEGIPTMILRLVGANFLHTLASGTIGFGWALSLVTEQKRKKAAYLISSIAAATALHGAFNAMVLRFGTLYLFPATLLLFTVGLLVLHEFDILKTLQKPIHHA